MRRDSRYICMHIYYFPYFYEINGILAAGGALWGVYLGPLLCLYPRSVIWPVPWIDHYSTPPPFTCAILVIHETRYQKSGPICTVGKRTDHDWEPTHIWERGGITPTTNREREIWPGPHSRRNEVVWDHNERGLLLVISVPFPYSPPQYRWTWN